MNQEGGQEGKKKYKKVKIPEEIYFDPNQAEEPIYPEGAKLQLYILELHKDEIVEHEKRGESYAIIRRREIVEDGERKKYIEIQVKNAWRFKLAMRQLSRQGLFKYDPERKIWNFVGQLTEENFIKIMTILKRYVKDVYIEKEIYNTIFSTLHRIALPDPHLREESKEEFIEKHIKPELEKEKGRVEKGTYLVPQHPREKVMGTSYREIMQKLNEIKQPLRGAIENLNVLAKMLGKKITVVALHHNDLNAQKLAELGYEYDEGMGAYKKEIPEAMFYEELKNLQQLGRTIKIEHTDEGINLVLEGLKNMEKPHEQMEM